ncbi:hypothetical protein [Paraburkholderia sediminicola]|uniref:hypothetical protein n=1 Tax=Paraburkholderia sediminicola TaxID=458836 RepID=UPI0038B6D227
MNKDDDSKANSQTEQSGSTSHNEVQPPEADHTESNLGTNFAAPAVGAVESVFRRIFSGWPGWERLDHYRTFVRDGNADHWGSRDKGSNDRIRLPDGEDVQIPVITVVELYTPSQIGGLLAGIAKLGWQRGISHDDDLLKWTSEVRQGRSAGSTNLGLVSPANKQSFMRERTAELPDGIHAAFPTLATLTPGITVLTMSFFLDDETASKLSAPLHKSYTTYTKYDPSFRWWNIALYVLFKRQLPFRRTIHNPDSQKRHSVAACVDTLEDRCIRWVRSYLPGAFSSGLCAKRLPSAILFVTEKTALASEEIHRIAAFDGMGFNNYFDTWKSSRWPSALLFLPRPWDESRMRLVFACRRKDAFPQSPGDRDPESNWSIAYRATELISDLLSRWALGCMLDGYHEQLSELRDQSAVDRSHRTVRDLKRLRSLVRTKFYDIVTCAHETGEFVQSALDYCGGVLDLANVQRAAHVQNSSLLNEFRANQRSRAQQVIREAGLLQSILSVSNDMSQTITNIRIQTLIVVLTVTSIGIGALSLWATIHSATGTEERLTHTITNLDAPHKTNSPFLKRPPAS